MEVHVLAEETTYRLVGGIANINWQDPIASGAVGKKYDFTLDGSLSDLGNTFKKRLDTKIVESNFTPTKASVFLEDQGYTGSLAVDVRKHRRIDYRINEIAPFYESNVHKIEAALPAVSTTSIARPVAQIATQSITRPKTALQIKAVIPEKGYFRYVLTSTPDDDWVIGDSTIVSSCQIAVNNGTFTILGIGSEIFPDSLLLSNTLGAAEIIPGGEDNLTFMTNTGTASNTAATIVQAIAIQADGKILIGGTFTTWNGLARTRLVRLNTDGTEDTAFYSVFASGVGLNGAINDIKVQTDGSIILGGAFTSLNGVARNYLLRVDSTGFIDVVFSGNLGTGFNAQVRSIAIHPTTGDIFVVGEFTTRNALTRNRITKLNSAGVEDATFVTNMGTAFNLACYAVEYDSFTGDIYVGGDFTNYGVTTNKNKLVRLNTDGVLDTGFFQSGVGLGVTAAQGVWALKADGLGNVYAGGLFLTYSGSTGYDYLAKFQSNGSPDQTFQAKLTGGTGAPATAINGHVRTIDTDGNYIYVGGSFTTFNRHTLVNRFGVLTMDGNISYKHKEIIGTTGFNASVYALKISGTKIYMGGDFTIYGTMSYNRFIRTTLTGVVQKGKIDLNLWSYNYSAVDSTHYVPGEQALFALHTSAGNNGNLTIYKINQAGNNIWVKNSAGVLQAGVVGNSNVNRWKYFGTYSASWSGHVGENVKMLLHTTVANNGNFPVRLYEATGLTVYNIAGVAQAAAAGNITSNRWKYFVNVATGLTLGGSSTARTQGFTTVANNGSFTVKEIGTDYVTLFNESAVAQITAGCGELVSSMKKLMVDVDPSVDLVDFIEPYVEINFTEAAIFYAGFADYYTANFGSNYIMVEEPSIVRQYGFSGFIEIVSTSIFGAGPTLTRTPDQSNGYLEGTRLYSQDFSGSLDGNPLLEGDFLGLWVTSNYTSGDARNLKLTIS
jgi:hypothetical protein